MSRSAKQHWFLLQLAIVFLTRWPIELKQKVEDESLNAATGYFALVGLIVASVSAATLFLASLALPVSVALVLAMVASIAFTGAFHEDGLADTADGLGGGWTVEAKLNIMKDSRIGTYGCCALLLALLLKFQLLVALSGSSLMLCAAALLIGHSSSRALAVSVIGSLEYVQLDQASKTKPVAKSLSSSSIKVLLLTLVAVVLSSWIFNLLTLFQICAIAVFLLLLRWGLIRFIRTQLGGYTGDVLGAFQQIFELAIYAALVVAMGS